MPSNTVKMEAASPYDYFVIVFPRPEYPTQPTTINCLPGPCYISLGNNWLFYKHNTDLNSGNSATITIKMVTNPKYTQIGGIKLTLLVIKNRLLVGKHFYGAITDFGTAFVGGSGFVVTVPNIDTDKVNYNLFI